MPLKVSALTICLEELIFSALFCCQFFILSDALLSAQQILQIAITFSLEVNGS